MASSIQSSEASDEESSDEDAQTLVLDRCGRAATKDGGEQRLNYHFRSFDDFLSADAIEAVRRDAIKCSHASAALRGEEYSAGSTWWVGADAKASSLCGLEHLALEVFELHAASASFDRAKSGAEWWTLSMRAAEGEVGWHWDRDYGLEDDDGTALPPHVSTVTYLTTGGVPTLVVPLSAPTEAQAHLAAATAEACFVSRPKAGKHVSFDGRFLHGSPQELASPSREERRVTLLVNVWLDYRPRDADPLPKETRDTLAPALPAAHTDGESAQESTVDTLALPPQAVPQLEWAFADRGAALSLQVRSPPAKALPSQMSSSLLLRDATPKSSSKSSKSSKSQTTAVPLVLLLAPKNNAEKKAGAKVKRGRELSTA